MDRLSAYLEDKRLGRFYTPAPVAQFLADWAIRSPHDRVLEPCFGDGSFVSAASRRLLQLGGTPARQIVGVDLDPSATPAVLRRCAAFHLRPDQFYRADFFDITAGMLGQFHVVIGNPPFVRYQRFTGARREIALRRAAEGGVILSKLASCWAPFLVHAAGFLARGGRIGMVLPYELAYAAYAKPILRWLGERFGDLQILAFECRLFPHLNEETVLLLASDYGACTDQVKVYHLADIEVLQTPVAAGSPALLSLSELVSGEGRFDEFLLSPDAAALYERLRHVVQPLGHLADVGIGYVTGKNDFFHPSVAECQRWAIDDGDLRPVLRRGRDLNRVGLAVRYTDWRQLACTGNYRLFHPREPLDRGAARYVRFGEEQGVHQAYKCRVRDPWYRVPGVLVPDMILTVMAGRTPRLVANEARVAVTNSLHAVRLRHPGLNPRLLAAASVNSLTELSAELEGHRLGGGLLKLEPSEARQLLLGLPRDRSVNVGDEELARMDACLRAGRWREAVAYGDEVFLRGQLGLSTVECQTLRQAVERIRTRRRARG